MQRLWDKKKPYHVPDTTEARVPGSKGENRLAEAGQICRTLQTMRSLDTIINPVGLHPHWKTRERNLRGGKDSRWFQPWNLTKSNVLFPIAFHLLKRKEHLFTYHWIAGCFGLLDMPPDLLPPLFLAIRYTQPKHSLLTSNHTKFPQLDSVRV